MGTGVLIALTILCLPLASAVILAVCGKKLPGGGDVVGIGSMGIALALSCVLAMGDYVGADMEWLNVDGTPWRIGILLDGLTKAMLLVVTLVSFLVHLFSKGYMHGDERYTDFYRWLGFFTFSMLGLILSDNLLTLYITWELMGLASYKLIGHYFFKRSAYMACKKAFMTTRVGDVGMFLAMLGIYMYTGTLQLYGDAGVFARLGLIPETANTWIALGLFFGAMGKSAQFPLHIWLPDAMEGPTPVSALIHAATMVAAGVYLVGRMYSLIALSPVALLIISIIGCFTAFIAATIAFTKTDIKAVLAYSTISQLGFMFTALGVGSNVAWKAGLFHLCTHACFKACLFLGSGSVIHACHHEQEMTKMGGLRHKMPITNICYAVSVISIAGFPLTAGFMSKDLILQSLWMGNGVFDEAYKVIFVVLACAAGMTAAYMMRNYLLTFWTKPRDQHIYDHAHESPLNMTIPLMVLATLGIAAGYGWHDSLLPMTTEGGIVTGFQGTFEKGTPFWDHSHHIAMGVSLFVALGGLALGWCAYQTEKGAQLRVAARKAVQPVYNAANRLYYMDDICEFLIIRTTVILGALMAWIDGTLLDSGVVDGIGRTAIRTGDASAIADDVIVDGTVNSVAGAAYGGGGILAMWQSGRIRNYLFGAVGTAALFAFLVLYVTRS